jgi:glycosyltransferase involved in cell wall biosynthesis
VIDDGSTDGGGDIVQAINEDRLKYIRQQNVGVSGARNRGIENASCNLISFLDADDTWEPTFLETIIRLYSMFPEAGIYATAYKVITEQGKSYIPKFKGIPSRPWEGIIPSYFKSALGPQPVWSSAVCIPRKVISEVGGFPAGVRLGEDLDMWGRVALRYPVAFSWQVGATYRMDAKHRTCTTTFLNGELPFVRTALKAIDKGNVPIHMFADLKQYIAREQIRTARECLIYTRNPTLARQVLCMSYRAGWRKNLEKYCWYLLSYVPKTIYFIRFLKKNIYNIASR